MSAPAAPAEAKTLLEFIIDLLTNADARAEFQDDPRAALDAAGLGDITVDELQELLPFLLERLDPGKAAHYEEHCDDDLPARDACDGDGGAHVWAASARPEATEHHHHYYFGKPDRDACDDGPSHHHHDVEIAKVVTHLNFVVNNYSIDSHDTIFNTTNTTVIWANNSDVRVDNDTVNQSGGDGAVLVGRDNNGTVVTGDEVVVGDGNQVASGDDSNTAFGSGSVNADNDNSTTDTALSFGSGAASTGGAATVVNTDASTTNTDSGNTTISDSFNDNSNNSVTDNSNNSVTDNSDNSVTDNSDNSVTDNSDNSSGVEITDSVAVGVVNTPVNADIDVLNDNQVGPAELEIVP